MKLRLTIWFLLTSICISTIWAVSPYPELQAKATRFFNHQEWSSASAMFDLMLEEKPDIPSTYGQAIVSAGMRHDPITQNRLMNRALDHHMPFDSIFSQVRQWSFHVGNATLYEDFLKQQRTEHPWLKRNIDSTLLKYYSFRRNGREMITYSMAMLDGAPDNINFLSLLGNGYMLVGDDSLGIETYEKILSIDPNHYPTLVTLGNWYILNEGSTSDKAHHYLSRAFNLHPTPYVAKLLKK